MTDARSSLQARVGIATGLVVVGDLIGAGAAQERGVVGETPNLAARLQGLAAPNTLVIAEATRRQIGELFELRRPRAASDSAGFAEPQCAPGGCCGESGVDKPLRGVALGGRRRSSGATRKSSCCCAAGSRRRAAKDGWC